jgi:hypothetical protein
MGSMHAVSNKNIATIPIRVDSLHMYADRDFGSTLCHLRSILDGLDRSYVYTILSYFDLWS